MLFSPAVKSIITVDIGNSRIKLGVRPSCDKTSDASPFRSFSGSVFNASPDNLNDLTPWLATQISITEPVGWFVSSVNSRYLKKFEDWLSQNRPQDQVHQLVLSEIPMRVRYDVPSALGIDRVIAAFAARQFFGPRNPILVVDVGTAVTIDLVHADGQFAGGVILPGPEISAYVLNERTDRLPSTHWDPARQFTYPATNTHDGIQLGIEMGLVGAVLAVYFNIVSTQQASVENCPEIIIPKKWPDSLVTDSIHGITQKDEENKDPELPVILITGHGCGQLNQYLRRCFAQFQYNGKPMQPVIRNCPEIILSGLFQILDQLMSNQTKSCFDGNI